MCFLGSHLRLFASRAERGVVEDDFAVLTAARDDIAVLEHANGEYRALVKVLRQSGNGICPACPNDDVAIAVAGQHVAVLRECYASHVSRLVPALENAHPLVQHTAVVKRPEGHVALAAGDDVIPLQRMPLGTHDSVH